MARIRTVKPELFRHEGLLELEQETKLPIRFSFIGLFTVADREGRFEWNPRVLKLDILPFDEIDFSRVLNALESRGFVVQYFPVNQSAMENGVKFYGFIPSFKKHQVINNKEGLSKLPDPQIDCEICPPLPLESTRKPRVKNATETPLILTSGEGKGKGVEKELEGNLTSAIASVTREDKSLGSIIWETYSQEFKSRYSVTPVRNAKTNSQCKQLGDRLGDDAVKVVTFYLKHQDGFYLKRQHDLGSLLQAAESLHTQWQRGQAVTSQQVRTFEKQSTNMSLLDQVRKGEV